MAGHASVLSGVVCTSRLSRRAGRPVVPSPACLVRLRMVACPRHPLIHWSRHRTAFWTHVSVAFRHDRRHQVRRCRLSVPPNRTRTHSPPFGSATNEVHRLTWTPVLARSAEACQSTAFAATYNHPCCLKCDHSAKGDGTLTFLNTFLLLAPAVVTWGCGTAIGEVCTGAMPRASLHLEPPDSIACRARCALCATCALHTLPPTHLG